jgi:hypothetical protein
MGRLEKQNKSSILYMDKDNMDFENNNAKFIEEIVIDEVDWKIFTDTKNDDISYLNKCKYFSKCTLDLSGEARVKKSPLCKFWILRDNKNIENCKNIALALCLNHVIGDGCTLYNIYNMINQDESNLSTQIRSLKIERQDYIQKAKQVTSVMGDDKNGHNGEIMIQHQDSQQMPYIMKSISRQHKMDIYKPKVMNFRINKNEIERRKEEYSRKISNSDGIKFISTNDIITSWLFSMNSKADCNLMAINLRPRLNLDNDLAGNYISAIYLNNDDTLSPINVRKRLNQILTPGTSQKVPNYKRFRANNGGVSTNWVSFYKKLDLEGLEMKCQLPFFDENQLEEKFMGLSLTLEDNIIIFQADDDNIGAYVFTGSNRISKEMIMNSDMCKGKIM